MRLVNSGTDSQFQFSIDGHKLRVIANDFVPIKPYITDSVIINAAQRYEVIIEASAASDNYWLRAFWVYACAGVTNDHPEDSTGIIRYESRSTLDPKSTSAVQPPTICGDEPLQNLEPHIQYDIMNIAGTTIEELRVVFNHEALFTWTINSSSLLLDWTNPTLQRVYNNESVFPTKYNVVPVDKKSAYENEWAVLVIQNKVMGMLGAITHPIHLHSHDLWTLAQKSGPWDGTTDSFMMTNPPRRDAAVLPAFGHLAIAFHLDTQEPGFCTAILSGMQVRVLPLSS
ncbi:hypothetical protein NX059_009656 [Plenodomus lindquistii]|nr:hypothetical protein NX059_009656 [Plenodomus lindquistii]